MRYVGLVFLGMVLWAGQAMAAELDMERSEEVLVNGKIISEHYFQTPNSYQPPIRFTRVIHDDDLFICIDNIRMEDKKLNMTCYDEK